MDLAEEPGKTGEGQGLLCGLEVGWRERKCQAGHYDLQVAQWAGAGLAAGTTPISLGQANGWAPGVELGLGR